MSVEEFTYLRGRTKRPVKVTLHQRAAGRGLLRSRQVEGRLCHARRVPGRSRGFHAARDRRTGAARLRVHPDRRAAVRGAARRDDSRGLSPARQRSRPDARRCIELDNAMIEGHPASPSASTSAAATTRACSTRRAATIGSPAGLQRARFHASCSSTTTSDRGLRAAAARARAIAPWCWGSSARRNRAMESRGRAAPRASKRRAQYRAARATGAQPAVRLRLDARGQPADADEQRLKLELVAGQRRRFGRQS